MEKSNLLKAEIKAVCASLMIPFLILNMRLCALLSKLAFSVMDAASTVWGAPTKSNSQMMKQRIKIACVAHHCYGLSDES